MDNNNHSSNGVVKDDAFWLNEIAYFETAQDALRKCFAIISSLKDHAQGQLRDLAPAREEVEV